mmetsp:Transcript_2148/g.3552  ORF Transcript_2148/g.3552 Transcript_2148/m.3552 type:complete len:240 (-) Transcript_2148:244-963(-)
MQPLLWPSAVRLRAAPSLPPLLLPWLLPFCVLALLPWPSPWPAHPPPSLPLPLPLPPAPQSARVPLLRLPSHRGRRDTTAAQRDCLGQPLPLLPYYSPPTRRCHCRLHSFQPLQLPHLPAQPQQSQPPPSVTCAPRAARPWPVPSPALSSLPSALLSDALLLSAPLLCPLGHHPALPPVLQPPPVPSVVPQPPPVPSMPIALLFAYAHLSPSVVPPLAPPPLSPPSSAPSLSHRGPAVP